ncbi:MAG: exodeoxyribonuclease V subunit gamma [Clostridiales bacterium]|jgi:ATP-dependent helicase/nuclease subunit B|nr:exodeoxyribonuclease V subunit gamma [Clostridiales bacterium]
MLKLIHGVAGSGKTTACFLYAKKVRENVIFIVPEGCTLAMEQKVAREFGAGLFDATVGAKKAEGSAVLAEKSTVNGGNYDGNPTENSGDVNKNAGVQSSVDVLSFQRLAAQVFARYGPLFPDNMTSGIQHMLMQKTLIDIQKRLQLLGSAAELQDFAEIMSGLFAEFERYMITPSELAKQAELQENSVLKLKLQDIARIYEGYIKEIEKRDICTSRNLDLLCERIGAVEMFSNTHFIFDSFTSFTPQEYAVIERILEVAPGVTIALTCGDLSEKSGGVFLESRQTAERLYRMAAEAGVPVEPDLRLTDNKKHAENAEMKALEYAARSGFAKARAHASKPRNVNVFCADNPYGEVDFCAKKILKLCRENGYRQSDIAIIANDATLYADLIRHIFPRYGIDIFVDDARSALKSVFIQGVLAFLDIWVQNFSSASVIKYLKCGAARLPNEDINFLENYVIASGLNSQQWKMEREITYIPSGFSEGDLLRVREILKTRMTPILNFDSKFEGRKTAGQIIDAISGYLLEINAKEYAEEDKDDTQGYEVLEDVLAQMRSVFGADLLTFKKFFAILKTGIGGYKLTQLPQTAKQAHFCAISRYKAHAPKCLFILGAQEGSFPAKHVTEGILTDNDRVSLETKGVSLAMTAANRQICEQQTVYSCLTSPRERLFLFHSAHDFEGEHLAPSPVISQIKRVFPKLVVEDNIFEKGGSLAEMEGADASFNRVVTQFAKGNLSGVFRSAWQWYEENRVERVRMAHAAFAYTNEPKKSAFPAIKLLYNQQLVTSVSRVESFASCQFAYFMRYGLRALPRKTSEITAPESGNIMHTVIERFCRKNLLNEDFSTITGEAADVDIAQITAKVLEEQCSENIRQNPRFEGFSAKIILTLQLAIRNILDFYKNSDFKPLEFELSFGEGGQLPPLKIALKSGEWVQLRGRVDRADIHRTPDASYISVVDYKSSDKNIDFADVSHGVQVQLPAYIHSLCTALAERERTPVIPAGMLYYNANLTPFADELAADVDVWLEIQKKLRMRGVTLENAGISKKFICGGVTAAAEIKKICDTALAQISAQLEKISVGEIALNPYKNGKKAACDYCPYKAACQFDAAKNKYNLA